MRGSAHLFTRDTSKTIAARKHHEHFYRRLPVQPPQYSTDDTELIPVTKKTGVIAVDLAEAKKLKIAISAHSSTRFNPTELPAVRFRGVLSISEVEEAELDSSGVTPESFPADVVEAALVTNEANDVPSAHGEAVVTATDAQIRHLNIKVKRDSTSGKQQRTKKQKKSAPGLFNHTGVIGMRHLHDSARNHTNSTRVASAAIAAPTSSFFYVVSVSAVAGVVLVAVLAGLESHVSASTNTFATTYQFTLATLIDLVKERFAALLVHSFGL